MWPAGAGVPRGAGPGQAAATGAGAVAGTAGPSGAPSGLAQSGYTVTKLLCPATETAKVICLLLFSCVLNTF